MAPCGSAGNHPTRAKQYLTYVDSLIGNDVHEMDRNGVGPSFTEEERADARESFSCMLQKMDLAAGISFYDGVVQSEWKAAESRFGRYSYDWSSGSSSKVIHPVLQSTLTTVFQCWMSEKMHNPELATETASGGTTLPSRP